MQERIDGFLGLLKSLKLWQIGVLAIVVFGSAGATYGVYASNSIPDSARLGENQQLIPVQYGNLVNQVSTNGSLAFPEREGLTFDSAGKVAEVLVKEGQAVTQGQVLARLDAATIISIEEAVAEARVSLRDAQTALAELDLEHAVLIAEADEAVANAELALQDAIEALDDAREPYTAQDIKAQEQVVAAARVDLKAAEEALADLGANSDLQQAEIIKTNREANAALSEARKALENFESNHALELASATQAKAAAEVSLKEANSALDSYEASQGANLGQLRRDKVRAEAARDELQGRIDNLAASRPYASGDVSSSIRALEDLLEIHQETLDVLQGQLAEVERLEAQVEVAERELADAKLQLAELSPGPDPLQRQELEAAVEVALADAIVSANALKGLVPGVDPLELSLKQSDLALAEAAFQQAEEDLADVLKGHDSAEVALRERQVVLAEANLALARADRLALLDEPDSLELAVRRAKLASAQRTLDDAVQRLEYSTLRSPINGLVSLVNVEEGDEVEASATIVEVVDTSIVEIDGIVDEIDVLSVREGITVQVTLDALPGQVFEGVVSEIAPAAQGQQGVVTYPISIQMEVPREMQLREGLTAVANIVMSEERDVLMVPQQALYGSFDQPVVRVMTSTGVEERRVSLGNTDDFWVVVREGVEEGEQVVMESAAVNTTGSGFGQIRRITSGGSRGRR